jgi:hypothetical protein
MRRQSVLALLLTCLLPGALIAAAPAQAATPLAKEVVLRTSTVTLGSEAGKDLSTYPAVVRVTGVSSAAAKGIARAVTSKGRSLARPAGGAKKTTAEINAIVAEADRKYVSVLFSSTYYADGAAHPYTLIDTLVFERSTGKVLGFKEIFKDPRKAVPTLAAEIKRNAKWALGPLHQASIVADALSKPTVSGLSALVPRPWGLEVFFAQGDLAASAAGPTSVLVPWQVLQPLLAIPLPDLGGSVPAPAYGGGQAVTDRDLLAGITGGVVQAGKEGTRGLTGRAVGSYRLVDTRRVVAKVADGVFDELYVTTVVAFASPSKPLAVLLALGGDEVTPSFDVIDVQRGAVGCGVVSSAYVKALKERCP